MFNFLIHFCSYRFFIKNKTKQNKNYFFTLNYIRKYKSANNNFTVI